MSWHFQDLHLETQEFACRRGRNQEIRLDRFNLQLVPEAAKEFRIGNHRRGPGMAAELTTEPAFDLRYIRDVIEVAVREQQQLGRYPLGDEPVTSPFRC